jgi:glutamine amidotransferase
LEKKKLTADLHAIETWVNVPTNSILTIHRQTVMVHPIVDQYYDRSPYHIRSAAFVQTKGLVANEKAATKLSASLVGTPLPDLEIQKRPIVPAIPLSIARSSRVPDRQRTRRSRTPVSFHEYLVMAARATSPEPPPAQGNIKKKRLSLNALELERPAALDQDDTDPQTSDTDEPVRTGNRNKISRFFPELTLS